MLQTAQFFSEEETEGGMDLEERRSDGGGEVTGVEGGETLVGMYCMREVSIFNKNPNKNFEATIL